MAEIAHPIKIDLPVKLKDKEYRQGFFLAEASAKLAEQITALRKRRGLNQTQLAEKVGTKQPAISRVEQADYQNWNFGTLRSIVGALDGRIRVLIEASEDVLAEYEPSQENHKEANETAAPVEFSPSYSTSLNNVFPCVQPTGNTTQLYQVWAGVLGNVCIDVASQIAQKDAEIAQLRDENATLKAAMKSPTLSTDHQVRGSLAMLLGPTSFTQAIALMRTQR